MFRVGLPELLVLLFLIGISLLTYFLPTIIALVRKKTNFMPILLVNLLLGWTFVGWVVALVWAFSTQAVDVIQAGRSLYPVSDRQGRLCSGCGRAVLLHNSVPIADRRYSRNPFQAEG